MTTFVVLLHRFCWRFLSWVRQLYRGAMLNGGELYVNRFISITTEKTVWHCWKLLKKLVMDLQLGLFCYSMLYQGLLSHPHPSCVFNKKIKLYFPLRTNCSLGLDFPNSQPTVLQCGSTNYVRNPSTGRSVNLHTLCAGFGTITRLHGAVYGNFPVFDVLMSHQQGKILWGLR